MTMFRMPISPGTAGDRQILDPDRLPTSHGGGGHAGLRPHFGTHIYKWWRTRPRSRHPAVTDPHASSPELWQNLFGSSAIPRSTSWPCLLDRHRGLPVSAASRSSANKGMVFATMSIAACRPGSGPSHVSPPGVVLLPFFSLLSLLIGRAGPASSSSTGSEPCGVGSCGSPPRCCSVSGSSSPS